MPSRDRDSENGQVTTPSPGGGETEGPQLRGIGGGDREFSVSEETAAEKSSVLPERGGGEEGGRDGGGGKEEGGGGKVGEGGGKVGEGGGGKEGEEVMEVATEEATEQSNDKT